MTRRAFAHYNGQMSDTEKLLHDIDAFLRETGMAPSTFGRKAVNDGKLVDRLNTGGSVTLRTASRIRAFLAAAPSVDAQQGAA